MFNHVVPEQRSKDAHDIVGTYELTSSVEEMRRTPKTADDMIELMKARHAVIMGGRPEMGLGRFKERANRAGSTEFVLPERIEGTPRRGFEIGAGLVSPFSRAVYTMFIASEVHPFADGNGRAARIMMNAELEAAGEVRLHPDGVPPQLTILSQSGDSQRPLRRAVCVPDIRATLDRSGRPHQPRDRRS